MFQRHIYSARDIFTTSAAATPAGLPSFCNLKISKRPNGNPPAIAGCGLYFFLHKGCLVYIGKFLGSIHDAFGGDIFSARWNRHISTLSLRGSRVSTGTNTLEKAMQEGLPEDLQNALRGVDKDTLAKDRGFMVPYKRLKYAAHERITRGSSWWYRADRQRENDVATKPRDTRVAYIGFRCVR